MPPYASSVNCGNDSDGIALGFTSPLMESISKSKSRIQDWVDHERLKIDSAAESYRQTLAEQETIINSQVEELATVQRERGMDDAGIGTSSDNHHDEDHPENIAEQKKALEEQVAKVQIDIMKLKTERNNREKRVQGKFKDDRSIRSLTRFVWERIV